MYSLDALLKYSKNLSLLYVEDNEDTRTATLSILEEFFEDITVAIDGVDGLEKYKVYKDINNRDIDLIISDINMPKKNGIDMINDIRKINPSQFAIVISAYNDSKYLIELIEQGIDHFILKPIKPKQLMDTLFKACVNITNRKLNDQFLIQQAQFASMGEMIDSIAHQWLQPISVIKMQTSLLEEDNNEELSKEYIDNYIQGQSKQLDHIVNTLREFRNFFRPNTTLSRLSYKTLVDSVLLLLKDNIVNNTIVITNNIPDNIYVQVIENEFKHIVINILNNAIDAFKNNHYSNKYLTFEAYKENDKVILTITDNAGGIPDDIIGKIFEANVTTKSESGGTGIGLYLCRQIIDKIGGSVTVENTQSKYGKGAQFSISLDESVE